MMRISGYRFAVRREPLAHPFGFKGGAFTEKWLTVTSLASASGLSATGIGGLAVLWSDSEVFFSRSEAGGNLAMALIAEEAARSLVGVELNSPFEAVGLLAEELGTYARNVTGLGGVRRTFVLNCLVSLDMALWKLFALEWNTERLDDLLPGWSRESLSEKHGKIARIPLVDYGMPAGKIASLADDGHFIFKVKLGSAGDQAEMLRRDRERLSLVNDTLRSREKILYYLDANGRYGSEETVLRLLDHADAIGMLPRVLMLEEPYVDASSFDVSGLPVRVAADESVHGPQDAAARASLGYGAFAIKPAGKTLSVSLETVREARRLGIPCFVADSACVPLLVEWNKCVAARLPALPGLDCGVLESNGEEHYASWNDLLGELPIPGAPWTAPAEGMYRTDDSFFEISGGIFRTCASYERLLPAAFIRTSRRR